jgi:hypothetical protein
MNARVAIPGLRLPSLIRDRLVAPRFGAPNATLGKLSPSLRLGWPARASWPTPLNPTLWRAPHPQRDRSSCLATLQLSRAPRSPSNSRLLAPPAYPARPFFKEMPGVASAREHAPRLGALNLPARGTRCRKNVTTHQKGLPFSVEALVFAEPWLQILGNRRLAGLAGDGDFLGVLRNTRKRIRELAPKTFHWMVNCQASRLHPARRTCDR